MEYEYTCPFCETALTKGGPVAAPAPDGRAIVGICRVCAGIFAFAPGYELRPLTAAEKLAVRNAPTAAALKRVHDEIVSRMIG